MLPLFFSNISISKDTVPSKLDNAIASGVLWQATAERFLLEVPGVARYLVAGGDSVTIDARPQAEQAIVDYFFSLTPLAALLYQRGLIVFHATAVSNGTAALLLAGDSGAGKSALLMSLVQRGWKMLSDELSAVALNEQGQIIVYPLYPEIALWPDVLQNLAIDASKIPLCDANRKQIRLPGQFAENPLPLKRIYFLETHSKSDVAITEISGSFCFRALGSMLYNNYIADVLMDKVSYLQCASKIAGSVPVSYLCRPRRAWSINEMAVQLTEQSSGCL